MVCQQTYPEELAQSRIIRLAWFALDVFLSEVQHIFPFHGIRKSIYTKSLVNQNLNTSSIRPSSSSDFPMLLSLGQHMAGVAIGPWV
jgi:hypothetical protein